MRRGSVVVDVAIDQGGCFETSRATTHAKPTYRVRGVVHYCVANMPGGRGAHLDLRAQQRDAAVHPAAPPTKGWRRACADDPHLLRGLNVHDGKVVYKAVADALDRDYHDPRGLL